MARPLRIEYAGAVYHVTSRVIAGNPVFDDDKDRILLPNIIGGVSGRYHWLCYAYSLLKKKKSDLIIADAIVRWGYSQREIADYLRLHYSTVSRLLNKAGTDISKVNGLLPKSSLCFDKLSINGKVI
ncbi:MAG: hypothetical protein A2157_04825 [Deltaproteobacteria bacterium RBG_16_47_11]|nr:MAG: hypothetical protein A2157_04825 [Deltaproteobacteria bacterium RBG_16_47_11]